MLILAVQFICSLLQRLLPLLLPLPLSLRLMSVRGVAVLVWRRYCIVKFAVSLTTGSVLTYLKPHPLLRVKCASVA